MTQDNTQNTTQHKTTHKIQHNCFKIARKIDMEMKMREQQKRMAVLVGCNYPNTPNELHGCINDVLAMRDTLVGRFGFDVNDIQVLVDAPIPGVSSLSSMMMPTGENIKKALQTMIEQAQTGDVLFFHYSGHGTRIPSLKPINPFRQDEAIVPCDFNLLTDVDFRQLVNQIPKGATLTIISDSCHSGGLIDKEKEQIGPSSIITTTKTDISLNPKTIPFKYILEHLATLTCINTSDIGTHLLEVFGANASLKFRLPLHDQPDDLNNNREDQGILLSGCQANETSADMNPGRHGGDGKAYGAFSNAVQTVFKENDQSRGGDGSGVLSNKQVVMLTREVLQAQGLGQQHPCLYCSDENADAPFLMWQP